MTNVIKYPIGEQSFERLRKEGFMYVDKTSYIEKIIGGQKYFFLGRPRRFGKSLFLSTIKCFFEGKRELFEGLHIVNSEWDWTQYPVIYLDLNNQQYQMPEDLDELLENFLSSYEREYGIVAAVKNTSIRFANLIEVMSKSTGKGVVILVDEYDKPLVNNIHDEDQFNKIRDKLGALYSNFKSSADHIRLVFMTGVSRFGKLSVFSDLNNISDISFIADYAGVCGITESELRSDFREGIDSLCEESGKSFDEEVDELKRWYDGYHFSEKSPDIYNPFSILHVMAYKYYDNFWIASGTPSLLVEQLNRSGTDLHQLLDVRCSRARLRGLDIDNIAPESLLYQTGYLTIKYYDSIRQIYRLGIPNREVEQGFFEYLLPYYSEMPNSDVRVFVFDFLDEMEQGRVDAFMTRLRSMFAGTGYDLQFDNERNVQNALLILFKLIGLNTDAEVRTSDGRIDLLVKTKKYVYIMELKFDGSPEEALTQIENKEYALPWVVDGREIIEIGINYSSEKRRIDGWKVR